MPKLRIAAGAALLCSAVLAGCSGSQSGQPEPQWAGLLIVKNRSNSDMDIYAARPSDRVRIGLAPNNQTTSFKISPAQVAGVGTVRFLAIPLAASPSRAISSEPITIAPTDTITLDIPPN